MRPFPSFLVMCLVVAVAACTPSTAPQTATPTAAAGESTLRVLVTSSSGGQPVGGARVCAARATGADICGSAAGDGTAVLHAAPGTYFVRVSGPPEQRWEDATRVADLRQGDASLWVELAPLHRISGRIRDEAGASVAGAEACAHPASDDPEVCARSGADGTYAIDVKAGAYRVEVSGPPGGRLVGQWARGRVFLEEADVLDARMNDVPNVDVTLVRGFVLSGRVMFEGKLVEDAQVCVRTLAAPLPWDCERTDKNGRYAALREPGTYYVWIVPPGNIRAVPQWYAGALTGVGSSELRLSADRTVDVDLTTGPQVSGVVRTPSGDPVTGALVCIDTAFTTGRICRESDGNGHYTITTRPETYIISVYSPAGSGLIAGYWNGKRTWNTADEVNVDGDVTLDLTVPQGVPVTGTVKDTRGIPVAGATVNFLDGQLYAAASTDTDAAGRFNVAVRPGRFAVEVFPTFVGGYVERVMTVDVQGAQQIEVTLDDANTTPP